ncbi:MAG: HAMP domain-containing histidine kinase [Clostridia bacterium]|nr:HAMP domain-containing histidine kinase [Clostridia bacterium]
MKRSLVKKFFFSFSVVALCSLVLLGSIIVAFTGNYCLKEKQTELRTSAIWISNKIASTGSVSYFQYKSLINFALNSTGGDIFITDVNGNVLISSGKTVSEGTIVPHNFATEALKGEMTISSNMKGFFPQKRLIVSVPVVMPTGKTVAVVYNTSSYDEMIIIIKDITALFLWASILVVVFLLFAAYLMTNRLVRPIKEMAEASHCISKGDFSKVITVDRDDEIGELAMEFNHMIQSLAAGEQMNRSFVANVSHELKTPMTSIGGFIDGILDGTISADEQDKYLKIVSAEVKRLSRIVVSMLNLAKIESGEIELNPERVNLSEMIINIALGFEHQINEKNIDIRGFDSLPVTNVYADSDLIYQVFYNLCENAIKYTPEGGYVEFGGFERDNMTTFYIRNSGKGIPEEELPHIFDRFYKVDKSRGTDRTGTGLGLYLVKTLVSLHRGTITVKSVEGQYCEFIVTLSDKTDTED